MELVIGGAYQEKLNYVFEFSGYTKDDVYDASIFYETVKLEKIESQDLNLKESTTTSTSLSTITINPNRDIDSNSINYEVNKQLDLIYQKPVLYQFHLFIKGLLTLNMDPYPIVFNLMSRQSNIIIIADEIGSGVVPMLATDREYRETTGRILCLIAKHSLKVHRVILGIGTIIKK